MQVFSTCDFSFSFHCCLFQKYDIKPTQSEMPLKEKNSSIGNANEIVLNDIDQEIEIMVPAANGKESNADVKFRLHNDDNN